MKRPDPELVLQDLKDFQRRTVDYVVERFYEDTETCRRFLVADEVGLGKTMVARGVIARTIERLWEAIGRIDVVYICSNADIARQNVRRLVQAVPDQAVSPIASRITLLPMTMEDLQGSKVNFVALTPGTSFSLRSNMGLARERRLLYWMLREAWDFGRLASPKNLLQGLAGRERFRRGLQRFDRSRIDRRLQEGFLRALEIHDRRLAREGERGLRERFEELCGEVGFATSRLRRRIPKHLRRAQAEVIGELRGVLAASCLEALEPDLIILDEFQRFKHLLRGEDDAGQLARELFDFTDEAEGAEAKVLLLSATPYKMYTLGRETEDDHYSDFLDTLEFLCEGEAEVEEVGGLLDRFRLALYRLGREGLEALGELRAAKEALEARLRRVMARTERLSVSEDRGGMLVEKKVPFVELGPEDIRGYLGIHEVAAAIGHGDLTEYWKTAPFLMNFMDGYAFKRDLVQALEDPAKTRALAEALHADAELVVSKDDWEAYGAVDPRNSRLRWLMGDVVERGAWKLLWVPPSLPYYGLEGPFAELAGFTKRLVFSAWRVVPRAVAAMVSYEVERRMLGLYEDSPRNTPEARAARARLLEFRVREGRPSGMSVLGLLYPSSVLAREADPLRLARYLQRESDAEGPPSLEGVLEVAVRRIEQLLEPLTAGAGDDGPEDESWYWAGAALLDMAGDAAATRAWLEREDLAGAWRGGGEEDGGEAANWQLHVAELQRVAADPSALGTPPRDLAVVLALQGLASPGVVALRALERVFGSGPAGLESPVVLRDQAGRIAEALRRLFNGGETTALLRGLLAGESEPYWRKVLRYGAIGCLQAVLDEHLHTLRDSMGLRGGGFEESVREASAACAEAMVLRTAVMRVDEVRAGNGRVSLGKGGLSMRSHFAARFGDEGSDDESYLVRAGHLREAFNSPFWPFVLATTSVGQEGLDFHPWCHAVVHWNLPGNPVDLEQREGRVHRYKGHAVRRNLARAHGGEVLRGDLDAGDPWEMLFETHGVAQRAEDASELVPYWIYAIENGARIERHVPGLPLSRELQHLESLRRALALYRMVFGQPRQEDLLRYLSEHLEEDEIERVSEELRIDLSPPGESTTEGMTIP